MKLNAVVFWEDGMWVAQCLEYDLVSCAETIDEIPNELWRQVVSQREVDKDAGREPFAGFKPAPQKYWAMYENAKSRSKPMKPAKSISQLLRELLRRERRVDARLFPVASSNLVFRPGVQAEVYAGQVEVPAQGLYEAGGHAPARESGKRI